MPKRLSFPADSRDQIERLYAPAILAAFPNYGRFWETFIGQRAEPQGLLPYGLTIPSSVLGGPRKTVEVAYHDIVLTHYAIFCDLAGAHLQVDEARTASGATASEDGLFLFVEAFTNFYHHIGDALYKVERIWSQVQKIQRTCLPATHRQQSGGLDGFLAYQGRPDLVRRFAELRSGQVCLRDNLVHSWRPFIMSFGTKFAIIVPIRRNPSPLPTSRGGREAQGALTRMQDDLHGTETFLNDVDALIAAGLLTCFEGLGISVHYD